MTPGLLFQNHVASVLVQRHDFRDVKSQIPPNVFLHQYFQKYTGLMWYQETDDKKPRGPQLRSAVPRLVDDAGVPAPGLCLRFPPSVSPHGAPSNSAQQGSVRERDKMRGGP